MFSWLTYEEAHSYEEEASRLGVSQVARKKYGFMREYQAARTAREMEVRPLPGSVSGGVDWGQKRHNFISRHMVSYRRKPTRRRYLALLMWAYRPPGPPPPPFSLTVPSRRRGSRGRSSRRARSSSSRTS